MMKHDNLNTEILTQMINRSLDAVQESKLGAMFYWVEWSCRHEKKDPHVPGECKPDKLHWFKEPNAGIIDATEHGEGLITMTFHQAAFNLVLSRVLPYYTQQEMTVMDPGFEP